MQRSKQAVLVVFAAAVILITSCAALELFWGFNVLAILLATQDTSLLLSVKVLMTLLFAFVIATSLYLLFYTHQNIRMSNKLVQNNEIGSINIDVFAIEAIALNAAKTAQAGIKTAKARAKTDKKGAIELVLDCVLYSEVDIPSQMAKIQERIKKDIERYTGLTVGNVVVKVNRVEVVGARVEK